MQDSEAVVRRGGGGAEEVSQGVNEYDATDNYLRGMSWDDKVGEKICTTDSEQWPSRVSFLMAWVACQNGNLGVRSTFPGVQQLSSLTLVVAGPFVAKVGVRAVWGPHDRAKRYLTQRATFLQ